MRLAQVTTLFLLSAASIVFADEQFQVSVSRSVAHPAQEQLLSALAMHFAGDIPPTRRLWISGLHNAVHCVDAFWWVKHDGSLGRLAFPDGEAEFHLLDELRDAPNGSFAANRAVRADDTRLLLHHRGQLWLATPTP